MTDIVERLARMIASPVVLDAIAEIKRLRALLAAAQRPAGAGALSVSDDVARHMVQRFLAWKLPESFNPDGGISFKRTYNEHTDHPMKHEPVGTNLFDAKQAEAMVRHMLEGAALVEGKPGWREGAEAMREACAQAAEDVTWRANTQPSESWKYGFETASIAAGKAIRALPLPAPPTPEAPHDR